MLAISFTTYDEDNDEIRSFFIDNVVLNDLYSRYINNGGVVISIVEYTQALADIIGDDSIAEINVQESE